MGGHYCGWAGGLLLVASHHCPSLLSQVECLHDADLHCIIPTNVQLLDTSKDATTNLEDAYAVGLVHIGADDAVADAAAEASARELEKTYGAAIGAGLVVAGEISWGGYETTAEGEDRGDGEELQYDEPGKQACETLPCYCPFLALPFLLRLLSVFDEHGLSHPRSVCRCGYSIVFSITEVNF